DVLPRIQPGKRLDSPPILEMHRAHGTGCAARRVAADHLWMPAHQPTEIPDERPDALDRRVDDVADGHRHGSARYLVQLIRRRRCPARRYCTHAATQAV